MKSNKRLVAIIISIALMLCAAPVTVLAAGDTGTWDSSTPPTISGWDGDNNIITVGASASGTLTIDSGSSITELTIDGTNGGGSGTNAVIDGQIEVKKTLTLTLKNVTINANDTNGAVWARAGSLTLVIDGTVRLNGQTTGVGKALTSGDLTIGGTGELHATGGTGGGGGIYVSGDFLLESGCTVHAKGGDSSVSGGNGVYLQSGATFSVAGKLYATGGNGGSGGDGIELNGNTSLTNTGTIVAIGGNGSSGNGGRGVSVHSGSNALTNNGTLTAIGGDGGDSTSGNGGAGGIGLSVGGTSGTIENGISATLTAIGGNGGDSTGGNGGPGGGGAYANNTITNSNTNPAAFMARGGDGGFGTTQDGNSGNATNIEPSGGYDTITRSPSFVAQGSVDLANPTNLVLKAENIGPFLNGTGYSFYSLLFRKPPALGNSQLFESSNIVFQNGTIAYDDTANSGNDITITMTPAAFGLHLTETTHRLTAGNYRAEITFQAGSDKLVYYVGFTLTGVQPLPPDNTDNSGGGGGGGGGSSDSSGDEAASLWLERPEAQNLAQNAKAQHKNTVATRSASTYGVRGNAWDRLEGLRYYHDTMDGAAVLARMYFLPEHMREDTFVSAHTTGMQAEWTKSHFEKWFKNTLRVLCFDNREDWGYPVEVAVKLDLTGMDTGNLYFYAYDIGANTYRRITAPDYWVDSNGYLHFSTSYAGAIIVSDGPLAKA